MRKRATWLTISAATLLAVVLSGCQAIIAGVAKEMAKSTNPVLWEIQFLTTFIRTETGQWPKDSAAYKVATGDSTNMLFKGFNKLDFHLQNDTLLITYLLKPKAERPEHTATMQLEFVDAQVTVNDTPTFTIFSEVQLNDQTLFQPNEGTLTFFEAADHSLSIIHEYAQGTAKTRIVKETR